MVVPGRHLASLRHCAAAYALFKIRNCRQKFFIMISCVEIFKVIASDLRHNLDVGAR